MGEGQTEGQSSSKVALTRHFTRSLYPQVPGSSPGRPTSFSSFLSAICRCKLPVQGHFTTGAKGTKSADVRYARSHTVAGRLSAKRDKQGDRLGRKTAGNHSESGNFRPADSGPLLDRSWDRSGDGLRDRIGDQHEQEEGATATFVRSVTTPRKYSDGRGDGLVLRGAPGGSKHWLWRGTVKGRRRDYGLGAVRYTSLAEARRIAFEYRKITRHGGDPKVDQDGWTVPTFSEGAELGPWQLSKLVAGLELGGTLHGFRSTFRTWAADESVPREITALCLAHLIGSAAEQADSRSDVLELRREVMND